MAASKGPQHGPKRGHLIIDTTNGGPNSRQGSVDGAMQKCGLCSLLSRLLRRAMCVGSRRGSGESYYQELAETNVSGYILENVFSFFLLLYFHERGNFHIDL